MTMDYSMTTTTTSAATTNGHSMPMISKPLVQPSKRDIKQQYKYVYDLLKQFEQDKHAIKTISGIFEPRIERIRTSIVDQSTLLIYQTEYEVIGRKCREILWFKGYYDLISLAKRLWKQDPSHNHPNHQSDRFAEEQQISNLIIEGISHFKLIIVNLERKFNLDLRYIVDFSFLDTYEKNLYTAVANETKIDYHNENRSEAEITKYAMETIHALLISLGDLHRYLIDFDFAMPKIGKDFPANYYFEAFKLNPKTGMAHNQLGTLMAGSNYNLDSIYHYLYSMSCPIPFGLSDSRVAILFQQNANYLGKQIEPANHKGDAIGLRDFIARYLLVVDVFFYDKEIEDFNSLCHCLLMDFRKMLQSTRTDLSGEILYKMIAIFFFCLVKLKTCGSNKIHSLNAFLVALCAELVDACSMKLKKFVASHEDRNERFQAKYMGFFGEFEKSVHLTREKHRQYMESATSSVIGKGELSANDEITSNGKLSDGKLSDEHFRNGTKNGLHEMNTNGGGRERESDVDKFTPLSSQSRHQKRRANLRRRRRRLTSENSDSDLSYFEDSASECEMDTDFSSDEESNDGNGDSWCSSDDDDNDDDGDDDGLETTLSTQQNGQADKTLTNGRESDADDDDVVIEDEQVIYLGEQNGHESNVFEDLMANLQKLQMQEGEPKPEIENFAFDPTNLVNAFEFKADSGATSICNGESESAKVPEKLRYKRKYGKVDPNIIIEFFKYDNVMVALKLLFDWLRANNNIIFNCFTTNPEFIDKIFDLINDMNIDIFTRKVYFDRRFIEVDDVREDLRMLFDIRQTIPLKEDVLLKEFSVFDLNQRHMDWTNPQKLKITENEENILRIFMVIDFGFALCKMKKFDYNFCSRSRNFIKVYREKRTTKRVRKRGRRNRKRRRNRDRDRRSSKSDLFVLSRNGDQTSRSSIDAIDNIDNDKKSNLKKGYLKNRQQTGQHQDAKAAEPIGKPNPVSTEDKHELMGKLWLRHEIEELEAKMSKAKSTLTPYLVVDSKALIYQQDIVKKLVKARKFVVLIPNAVLAELDDLKKTSDKVRNVIRWLEHEFTRGSRFIRLQRNNESKPLTLIKVPKKLDHESSAFIQIVQFCNFINESHQMDDENQFDGAIDASLRPKVVTFVTGEKLIDRKLNNISFTGILDAIGVNFEQITEFYSKFKKK